MKNIDDVDLKVRMKAKGAGRLRVKQMPNGVNANDIRTFIREYEIQCGEKVDCLLVDYLDLMMPISQRVSGGDLFIKWLENGSVTLSGDTERVFEGFIGE